jgi:uncharacterized protein (TIGR02246 family)
MSISSACEGFSRRILRLSCASAIAIGLLCSLTSCADNPTESPFRRRSEAEKSNQASEGKSEVKSEADKSEADKSEANKSEANKSEANKSEANKSEAESQPESPHKVAAKPEAAKPEAAKPKAAEPEQAEGTKDLNKTEVTKKKTPEQLAKEQKQQAERDTVESATTRWLATVTSGRPNAAEDVMKLYAEDAMLLGTVSEQVRDTRSEIKTYFDYFTKLPKLSVSGYRSFIRVYGDTAINSGYYTFSYEKEGQTKVVPARYTFSYRKINGKWLIEDHHSSAIPKAPEKLAPAID